MDTTPKYYVCTHCGNVAEKLHDSGVDLLAVAFNGFHGNPSQCLFNYNIEWGKCEQLFGARVTRNNSNLL